MAGKVEKEKEVERIGNQGICVKCRRVLPASSFERDATGVMAAWCSVCRGECARNWNIDPDLVEFLRCLYVYEQALKLEAENVMQSRIRMSLERPEALQALKNRIDQLHRIRHTRIPDRLRSVMRDFREAFYFGVGMEVPDVVLEQPAASARG